MERKTEHPILFSTPMVQAIMGLIKIMTRRTIGLEKINENPDAWIIVDTANSLDGSNTIYFHFYNTILKESKYIKCPYGQKGDTLWVKEMYYAYGFWDKNGKTKTGKDKYSFDDLVTWDFPHQYHDNPPLRVNDKRDHPGWFKRSSLFMPRKASRILLEIINIRVERLQDITEEDAKREGVFNVNPPSGFKNYLVNFELFVFAKASFRSLWCKINGDASWNANPWVWVIEFKRIDYANRL